jgi:two-component system cell cycle sensor histidine kinase/response regulator CckA
MSSLDRQLNYYRQQCDELGRQVLQLQADQVRAQREARRSRIVAKLVRKAYQLGGGDVEPVQLSRQFLQIILSTLNVDCAVILQYDKQRKQFATLSQLGCKKDPAPFFTVSQLPDEFLFINSNSQMNPLFVSMQNFFGMPYLLWAMDRKSGIALLLGNAIENQHLHRPFNDNDREVMEAALMVFFDISARISSEQALVKSEEKYRFLVENANDAIFVSQKGVIKFHNSMANQILGYSPEELATIPLSDMIYSEDKQEVLKWQSQIVMGQKVSSTYPFRLLDREGKVLWVDLNCVQIEWEGEPATLNFCRDVTQQKQLESQLRNTQKMEAIGSLAGGIAHDFNNILSAMIGYSELTALSLPEGSVLHANMKTILDAGFRAKELVQQILTFSKQHEKERVAVKLSRIVKEALKLLRPALPSTIEIKLDLDTESEILADPTQLHQVVMNLCTNAYHAMQKDGGVLTVSLSEIFLDQQISAMYAGLEPGTYLKLTIRDTGCGMDEACKQRIFDPYFTTKDKNKGTGLGLAVVHGIVTSLNGSIRVESQLGKGSMFEILLPKIETNEVEKEADVEKELTHGNARILFVDDEEMLVTVGKELLEQLGFSVVACTSTGEALQIFRQDPDCFDLVITDLTMPKMTGDRFANEICQIRPDIPIILCTGSQDKIAQAQKIAPGITAVLVKPVNTHVWADTIHRALES